MDINFKFILISILCISLFSCNEDNYKNDAIAIIKLIEKKEVKEKSPLAIADSIGYVSHGDGYSDLSIDMILSLDPSQELLFYKDDMRYIAEQKDVIHYKGKWSNSNFPFNGEIINVFKLSQNNTEYSKEWFESIETELGYKYVLRSSYPSFNLNHDGAFVTYAILHSEFERNISYKTCTFVKEPNGTWVERGCKFLIHK